MTAQQTSEHGNGHEHERQRQVVAPAHPAEQLVASRGMAAHAAHQHRRPRTICICVDDFGLHAGVNEAALGLARLDRVHAIGCLVGGQAWSLAWSALLRRQDAAGIDIGLHLDLTESPLLPRSRRRLPSLIAHSLLGRLDPLRIRAEIRAQLETFEQVLGRGPAFVDGHRHVHQLATVRDELLDELARRYRGHWPWLRSTRTVAAAGAARGGDWRTTIKARGIEMLGSGAMASAARRMGFSQNRGLLGVYDFKGGPGRYARLLAAWLASAEDADLLMSHPSVGLHAGDPISAARDSEYQVLASTAFGQMVDEAAVTLRPMSHILASSRRAA